MSKRIFHCTGCHHPLLVGEQAVLRHIRDGKLLGSAVGELDTDTTVVDNLDFANVLAFHSPNSSMELFESTFELPTSVRGFMYLYNGEPFSVHGYVKKRQEEEPDIFPALFSQEISKLPIYKKTEISSGLQGWHGVCYDEAVEKGVSDDLNFSDLEYFMPMSKEESVAKEEYKAPSKYGKNFIYRIEVVKEVVPL